MLLTTVVYTDFDGSRKTVELEVHEPREGEFYAQNLAVFGCGKTFNSVVHWKPVRAAINDLLGGRNLISYTVPK